MITANYLTLVLNNDNLVNQAVFYWSFLNQINGQAGNKIAEGNIIMTDSDYIAFNTSSDSNAFAWNWAAQKLGVTIIP